MKVAEKVVEVAKRRGFFWPAVEIHKNIPAGFWVYGPHGNAMRLRLIEAWRKWFVKDEGAYEIDTPTLLPRDVFVASGHLAGFVDKLTECKKCHNRFRADHLVEDNTKLKKLEGLANERLDKLIKKHKIKCPKCAGKLGKVNNFNLMFKVNLGATGKETGYFRPETTQGSVVEFNQLFRAMRGKLPFITAQTGRAYRNEISPRNALIRMREFQQMEIHVFFDPKNIGYKKKFNSIKKVKLRFLKQKNAKSGKITEVTAERALKTKYTLNKLITYWLVRTQQFYTKVLGFPKSQVRFRELSNKEKAHYAKRHWDLEVYTDDFGWVELVNNAYRTDYDLKGHSKVSGKDLSVFDEKRIVPHMFEPSIGVDRTLFHLLLVKFRSKSGRKWFKLPARMCPLDVAVFPLVRKDRLPSRAKAIYNSLREEFNAFYDEKGSIGRLYRRMDEIGCPFCVTVDHKTLKNNTVTVRERDSMKQKRVKVKHLADFLREAFRF